MNRRTYWLGILGSSAALMAPGMGFAATSWPTMFNPTVVQAMDYVSGRTALALNAPTQLPQWQHGYLSATASAQSRAYRVDLWDTRVALPLNAGATLGNRLVRGSASFGELRLAAPLARPGSPGYLTPLIRRNPMWVTGTVPASGSLALGEGIRAMRYRVAGKTLLEWSEGDWTIQVGGTNAVELTRAARSVVRLLHAAFLPPFPGVYAVDLTGQGTQAVTTIDWARGRTLAWVQNRHASMRNSVATGRMAMSWRVFSKAKSVVRTGGPATPLQLGPMRLMLPSGWTRQPVKADPLASQSVTATSANGGRITLRQLGLKGSNIYQLLPQLPKPSGLTQNPWNARPYFSESRTTVSGVIQFQMTDLTASGVADVVTLQVPSQDASTVDAIQRSLKVPEPATIKEAVHLLLAKANPGVGLPLASAQAGQGSGWLLAGGPPATAQEGWFLFHTQNSGKTWRIEAETTWSAPFKPFPDSVGTPSMLFWNAKDGLIAMPSYASAGLFVYRTTDGGTSWTERQLATPGQPNNGKVPQITRYAGGRLTLKATLYSGKTVQFTSTDGGATWNRS